MSEWPAPIQEPAVKEEIHVPEATGNNRPVLNPDASMELFQDTNPPEPPQAKARAPTAAPVSKWTIAEDLDTEQSTIPVSKWVAQEVGLVSSKRKKKRKGVQPLEAEQVVGLLVESGSDFNIEVFVCATLGSHYLFWSNASIVAYHQCHVQAAIQAVKEEEEVPPPLPTEAAPRPPAAAPVSKWTLVDYDEDNPPADLEGCAVAFRSRISIDVSILALFPAGFCDVTYLL